MTPYTKFIIDPVIVYFHPEAKGQGVDPEDLKRLTDYFRDAVIKELKETKRYSIVEEPGPDVLHIRAAITDVNPTGKSNLAVKAGTVAAVRAVPGVGLLVPRIDVGSVSVEVEMLDSESDERLTVIVANKAGRRFFAGPVSLFKKWGDVEKAFRQLAEAFRARLEELQAQT